jgi:hypothetical protein
MRHSSFPFVADSQGDIPSIPSSDEGYDGPMDHKAEVQKLINACEAVIKCASENDGLSQADCETVLFYARTLLLEVKPQCVENHSRDKKLNADKP